jgi:hypothetical protein
MKISLVTTFKHRFESIPMIFFGTKFRSRPLSGTLPVFVFQGTDRENNPIHRGSSLHPGYSHR